MQGLQSYSGKHAQSLFLKSEFPATDEGKYSGLLTSVAVVFRNRVFQAAGHRQQLQKCQKEQKRQARDVEEDDISAGVQLTKNFSWLSLNTDTSDSSLLNLSHITHTMSSDSLASLGHPHKHAAVPSVIPALAYKIPCPVYSGGR